MTGMARLNQSNLPADVPVPGYGRFDATSWIVHIGPGNFHRAHQGFYLDALRNAGDVEWGMRSVGVRPGDAPRLEALAAQDGLYTIRETATDGTVTHRVSGAIADVNRPDDWQQVLDWLSDPATRIVTLTVTEGGYYADPRTGAFLADDPAVAAEWRNGEPQTVFGYLVRALARRREAGVEPFTLLSCDNVLGNGHAARAALVGFAQAWDKKLAKWISSEVATPSSMVDGITPAAKPADLAAVAEALGVEDEAVVTCEPFRQWVVEDHFPTGRPRWEDVGVELVSDVAPYEHMKLRMLNAGHQVLGHLGRLAGLDYVHEACLDPDFGGVLEAFWRDEAQPVCPPVPVDLVEYCRVLRSRFSNEGIADTVERIVAYASDRIPGFVLPTVADNLQKGGPVEAAALVVAAWAAGLRGVDEQGRELAVVDDRRDELLKVVRHGTDIPLALLDHPQLAAVGADQRFRTAFVDAFESLSQHGVRGAARALLAGKESV